MAENKTAKKKPDRARYIRLAYRLRGRCVSNVSWRRLKNERHLPCCRKVPLHFSWVPELYWAHSGFLLGIKKRLIQVNFTLTPIAQSGFFLTITVIADFIEAEFVLLIRDYRLAGVSDADDALDN